MAKDIKFGAEARQALQAGVDKLADTVRVTLLDLKEETLFSIRATVLQQSQTMVLLSQRTSSLMMSSRTWAHSSLRKSLQRQTM